ncbi:MAG: TRAP transporter substrate-binding protein [Candidatus Velthaea sp.]
MTKQHHSRSQFLAGTAGVFASIGFLRYPAGAAEVQYKMGHDLPLSHPLHIRLLEMWSEIEHESGGRLKVSVFGNNQLGGDTAMISQLRTGAIQFVAMVGSVLSSVVPVTGIEGVGFAFHTPEEPTRVMDGPLGQHIRSEIERNGFVAFDKVFDLGLRQMSSSVHPIRNVADMAGYKVRTLPAKIATDLFASLGASPTPMNFSEVYTALQTHVVDGQETPLLTVETARLYEVQKYLSITNHQWAGYWILAFPDAFKSLPADVQEMVRRGVAKYAVLQRRDVAHLNATLTSKLRSQGLTFNDCDTASMRAKLGPYYARWKETFGEKAWSLLEAGVGKLA